MASEPKPKLLLPIGWEARDYQVPVWNYLKQGGRRAVVVWHRRAGKDVLALNWTACAASQRPGTYWHMLPEAAQGRKVIWEGIDRDGRRMIDQAFPKAIRAGRPNESEMRLRLVNGSVWQVVGSDNYDALVGANPIGVVFSEFSLANPAAWNYLRPILAENGGWALFVFTPRGENHAFDLYEMARGLPGWFAERLTVDDTQAINEAVIEEERRSGMPEALVQQEYFCSFSAALVGSYFGALLEAADSDGRVSHVAHDPLLPVHTAWDLGIGDSTAIWFFQVVGREIRIVDYYENHGEALGHYAEVLRQRGYAYGDDWVPHDARVRELGTGRTRVETLKRLGRHPRVVAGHTLEDGINAARETLPRCWFDRERCQVGLRALRHYQRDWDSERHCFDEKPRHDWTSHAADAFRYLALAWAEMAPPPPKKRRKLFSTNGDNEVGLDDLWPTAERKRRRV